MYMYMWVSKPINTYMYMYLYIMYTHSCQLLKNFTLLPPPMPVPMRFHLKSGELTGPRHYVVVWLDDL